MFVFTVAPDGGEPFEVTAAIRDCVAWERAHPGRSAMDLEKSVTITDAFELAYFASKRQSLFDGSLDDFELTCDVTETQLAAPQNPTQPDRSGASSSKSRSARASRRPSGSTSAGKGS
jgi:hypothetical protein